MLHQNFFDDVDHAFLLKMFVPAHHFVSTLGWIGMQILKKAQLAINSQKYQPLERTIGDNILGSDIEGVTKHIRPITACQYFCETHKQYLSPCLCHLINVAIAFLYAYTQKNCTNANIENAVCTSQQRPKFKIVGKQDLDWWLHRIIQCTIVQFYTHTPTSIIIYMFLSSPQTA